MSWKECGRARGTHFLENRRGGDKSGHGKKARGQGKLTNWGPEREETSQGMDRKREGEGNSRPGGHRKRDSRDTERKQLRKENSHPGDRRVKGGTSKDIKRKQPRKGNSHPGEWKGRLKSGRGKEVTGQGPLTTWRPQREVQFRSWKESGRARGTHILRVTVRETSQDMERK